jgi:hypothetical protein
VEARGEVRGVRLPPGASGQGSSTAASMAETAALPARTRRKDSEILRAQLSAARRFSGQARHVRGTGHSMAVRTDGVRRRYRWLGGASRFAWPVGVRRVAMRYWAQTSVRRL